MNSGAQDVCADDIELKVLAGLLGRERHRLHLQVVDQDWRLAFHEAVGEALR